MYRFNVREAIPKRHATPFGFRGHQWRSMRPAAPKKLDGGAATL